MRSPKETEAIVPALLQRCWEVDNDKEAILWEMGNQGGVSGDCFVKVAYEEPYMTGIDQETGKAIPGVMQRFHPGRVRILPLNSAHCVDEMTEVLTRDGWKTHDQVSAGTEILTINPKTDDIVWQPMKDKVERHHVGDMFRWKNERFDALTTEGHRWMVQGRSERRFAVTSDLHGTNSGGTRLVTGGGTPLEFSPVAKYSDEWVEMVAWFVTEGSWNRTHGAYIYQSEIVNPEKVARIRRMAAMLREEGFRITEQSLTQGRETIQWYIGADATRVLRDLCPDKQITSDFLCNLTFNQAQMFYDVLIQADGHRLKKVKGEFWYQDDQGRVDAFQMLAGMLGKRTHARRSSARPKSASVTVYGNRLSSVKEMDRTTEKYDGVVWCPVVENTTWFARRNGVTFWTGNCFPEWHPHDRSRFLRFKLKYRFWGTSAEGTRQVFCVDDQTEALTRRGWLKHDQITTEDEVLALDKDTNVLTWQPVLSMHRFDWDGDLTRWSGRNIDALTTPNHRWVAESRDGSSARFVTTEEVDGHAVPLRIAGGVPQGFADHETLADELVELLGWVLAEGHYQARGNGVIVSQSESHNPQHCARLRDIQKFFAAQGATANEYPHANSASQFYFGKGIGALIRRLLPGKQLPMEVLCSLTERQARLLLCALDNGDGHQRAEGTRIWAQKDQGRVDAYQALCSMLGVQTRSREHGYSDCRYITAYSQERVWAHTMRSEQEHYQGVVWCPRTPSMTWVARRNGITYVTGNTYTELITDEWIEEYVNDEMIDQRPNPLGTVPCVHISNTLVSGSPWGLADIADVIPLNRLYNEIATDVADIINYHAAPVTVITGAKAGNMEKGPKKVWGGLPKDAQVFNLELGSNLSAPQEFLDRLKVAMHEMTGVHETALGQAQPISNTSGVALAIQFQPLMQRYGQKKIQYTLGLQRINELVLMTIAVKEPLALEYNPSLAETPLREGQLQVLDPADPISYQSVIHWPPPLPIDVLVKLQEIQQKMMVGLESKRGALRDLGKENPDATLQEIFEELLEDTEDQAVLDLRRASYQAAIAEITGMTPDGQMVPPTGESGVTSAGGSNVDTASGQQQPGTITKPPATMGVGAMLQAGDIQKAITEMVTQAFSPRMSRRNPSKDDD